MENPEVRREMLDVARFWLDFGVDGFRVDAAPCLFEREGTPCESLPETHGFLKELRRCVDTFQPPRVLLAEANQNIQELAEIGLNAAVQTSKSLGDLRADGVDDVVVLAEEAWHPAAQRFPDAVHHYWPMRDPIALSDPAAVPAEVRRAREELQARLKARFETVTK